MNQLSFVEFFKKYFVLIVLFICVPIIILAGCLYVKTAFKSFNYLHRKNKEYTLIKSTEKVTGVIDSVYPDRGVSFIKFTDSTKICFDYGENKMYTKNWLCEFLQKGDSIVKYEKRDTLFVFRQDKKFYFIIGQSVSK